MDNVNTWWQIASKQHCFCEYIEAASWFITVHAYILNRIWIHSFINVLNKIVKLIFIYKRIYCKTLIYFQLNQNTDLIFKFCLAYSTDEPRIYNSWVTCVKLRSRGISTSVQLSRSSWKIQYWNAYFYEQNCVIKHSDKMVWSVFNFSFN